MAGIRATRYLRPLRSLSRKTVRAQRVKQASDWLARPKYLHITLKPSALATLNQSSRPAPTKSGRATSSLLSFGFWSMRKASAMMRRALRKAVSPLVIGAATTPRMASMPPTRPSQLRDTMFTI